VHVVAYQIAPYQNGMVTIMIPQIRFSDRPLRTAIFPVCYGAGLQRCHAEANLSGHRVKIISGLPESARPFVDERT